MSKNRSMFRSLLLIACIALLSAPQPSGAITSYWILQDANFTFPETRLPYDGTHGVSLDGQALFFAHVRLFGGPAPVRRFLPRLIDLVEQGKISPGKVFDLVLPLDQVAEGYRAMDERRAIKALLRP